MMTTKKAAAEKGCSPQAIRDAVKREALDGDWFGRARTVKDNKKFREWFPSGKQRSGKARQKQAGNGRSAWGQAS